jgi:hypothetical protein
VEEKMNKLVVGLLTAITAAVSSFAAYVDVYPGDLVGKYTMTADNEYLLRGICFVEAGDTLVIQPGTVIRGLPGLGATVSALIIKKNAYVNANGTVDHPIIMTAITDNLNDPNDLGVGARGLWGGFIVCGNGILSRDSAMVEGLPPPAVYYGGTNNADNSGILRYISIRHAGSAIATNSEINGLTLCGIGSGTVVDHIDIMSSDDDGIEIFGGAVNVKYISSCFNDDDAFDFDQNYVGKCQFLYSLYNNNGSRMGTPDAGLEMDGMDAGDLNGISHPQFYNATIIGPGKSAVNNGSFPTQGKIAMVFKENMAGTFRNMIVMDFKKAIRISNSWTPADAYTQWMAGQLTIRNSMFWNISSVNTSWDSLVSNSYEKDTLAKYNYLKDPRIRGISRDVTKPWLDPRPEWGSPACSTAYVAAPPVDDFFSPVTYIGAFSPKASECWIDKWTYIAQSGILTKFLTISPRNSEFVNSGSGNFDLNFFLKVSPSEAQLNSYVITLDGVDATAYFASKSTKGNLTLLATHTSADGVWYRIPNELVSSFGAASSVPHVLAATFTLLKLDGTGTYTVSDTVSYKRLQ